MYYIKLNKVENEKIIRKFYHDFYKYKLYNNTYISYVCDLESLPQSLEVDFNIIFLDDLLKTKNIKNVIDHLKGVNNVVFDRVNEADLKRFKSINKGFNLKYHSLNLKNDISLDNLDFNDICIIKDFFQMNFKARKFNKEDFIIHFEVKNDGSFLYNTKKIGNILEEELISLITSIKIIPDRRILESRFGTHLYDPYYFLNETNKVSEEQIVKYKIKLFDLIKNISIEDILKLPLEIREILTQNYFIKWDDLIDIIYGKDKKINEIFYNN